MVTALATGDIIHVGDSVTLTLLARYCSGILLVQNAVDSSAEVAE